MSLDTGIKKHDLWDHPDDAARLRAAEQELLQQGPLAKLESWLSRTQDVRPAVKPVEPVEASAPRDPQVDVWAEGFWENHCF